MYYDINQIKISIILSIIQGITEFLPISSTSHIIIISQLLQLESNKINLLKIFIQLGSALAILYQFKGNNKYYYHITTATLPILIIGLFLHNYINLLLTHYKCILYGSLLGSLFLFLSELSKPNTYYMKQNNKVTLKNAFIIGCFQCFALWPGVSRLGVTTAIALILGIKRSESIKFSLQIAVPILIITSIYDLINKSPLIQIYDYPFLLLSIFETFLISVFVMKYLLKIITNLTFTPFIIYRISITMMCLLFHIY